MKAEKIGIYVRIFLVAMATNLIVYLLLGIALHYKHPYYKYVSYVFGVRNQDSIYLESYLLVHVLVSSNVTLLLGFLYWNTYDKVNKTRLTVITVRQTLLVVFLVSIYACIVKHNIYDIFNYYNARILLYLFISSCILSVLHVLILRSTAIVS